MGQGGKSTNGFALQPMWHRGTKSVLKCAAVEGRMREAQHGGRYLLELRIPRRRIGTA